jgi:hypothetical protein
MKISDHFIYFFCFNFSIKSHSSRHWLDGTVTADLKGPKPATNSRPGSLLSAHSTTNSYVLLHIALFTTPLLQNYWSLLPDYLSITSYYYGIITLPLLHITTYYYHINPKLLHRHYSITKNWGCITTYYYETMALSLRHITSYLLLHYNRITTPLLHYYFSITAPLLRHYYKLPVYYYVLLQHYYFITPVLLHNYCIGLLYYYVLLFCSCLPPLLHDYYSLLLNAITS